jgi:hypothetical protein
MIREILRPEFGEQGEMPFTPPLIELSSTVAKVFVPLDQCGPEPILFVGVQVTNGCIVIEWVELDLGNGITVDKAPLHGLAQRGFQGR